MVTSIHNLSLLVGNEFSSEGYFFGKYDVAHSQFEGVDRSKKCFVFAGQGSVKPGMFADYYQGNKTIKSVFDRADDYLQSKGLPLASTYIVSPKSLIKSDLILARTLSLLTLEVAQFEALCAHSIRPAVVTGHSFGDFAALVAAGVMSLETMLDIVVQREAFSAKEHELGYLLVAYAGDKALKPLAGEMGFSIANRNSPNETAIAVKADNAKQVKQKLRKLGIKANILRSVPQPYHCTMMAPVSQSLKQYLQQNTLEYSKPKFPVLSATTGEWVTDENFQPEVIDTILSRNVVNPIDFVSQIENIFEIGVCQFIEIGPSPVCTAFVENVLNTKKEKTECKVGFVSAFLPKAKSKPKQALDAGAEKVFSRINRIIGKVTGYEIAKISIEDKYQEELGIDSLKKAEIIVTVLDDFAIPVAEGVAISEFETIEDTVTFIQKLQSNPVLRPSELERQLRFQPYKIHWRSQQPTSLSRISKVVNEESALGGKKSVVWQPLIEGLKLKELIHYSDFDFKKDTLFQLEVMFPWESFNFDGTHLASKLEKQLWPVLLQLQEFLVEYPKLNLNLLVISSVVDGGSDAYTEERLNTPIAEAFFGCVQALTKEFECLKCKRVFLDAEVPTDFEHECVLPAESRIDFTKKQKRVAVLAPIPAIKNATDDAVNLSVVVAIGGAKGITYSLLQQAPIGEGAYIYLIGRSRAECREVEKSRQDLESKGYIVDYYSLDATKKNELDDFLSTVVHKHGAIDLLINGAGVIKVDYFVNKTKADFSSELFSKVLPAFNVLSAARRLPIQRVVNFSSVLGYFGGSGQAFYCAANAFINSMQEQFLSQFPRRQVLTLCWPPWDQKGMTDNSLVMHQLKSFGLALLPEDQAADLFWNDVVGGRAGVVFYLDSFDFVNYSLSMGERDFLHTMLGDKLRVDADRLLFTQRYNVDRQPFLKDHLVNGAPCLPAAVMVSQFYWGAFLQNSCNVELRNIDFVAPVMASQEVSVQMSLGENGCRDISFNDRTYDMSLSSHFLHSQAQAVPQVSTLRLKCESSCMSGGLAQSNTVNLLDFYQPKSTNPGIYHGPSFRVLHSATYLQPVDQDFGSLMAVIEPNQLENIHGYHFASQLTLWVEAAFQAAGLLVWNELDERSIPKAIGSLKLGSGEISSQIYIYCTALHTKEKSAGSDVALYNSGGECLLLLTNVSMSFMGKT